MRVVKRMVILSGGEGNGQGVLKLDKVGANATAQLSLFCDCGSESVLCVQRNDEVPFVAKVAGKKSHYELPFGEVDGELKCMVLSKKTPMLTGSTIAVGMDLGSFLSVAMPILEELFREIKEIVVEKNDSLEEAGETKETKNSAEPQDATKEKNNVARRARGVEGNTQAREAVSAKEGSVEELFKNAEEPIDFGSIETQNKLAKNAGVKSSDKKAKSEVNVAESPVYADNFEDARGSVVYDMERKFFDVVAPQVSIMFDNYPEYEELEKKIPSSKWVRIDTDDDFYVIGLLFEGEQYPKYLCYGVPANRSELPPDKVDDSCQWLSVANEEEGFYIMYQDCVTGENLKR